MVIALGCQIVIPPTPQTKAPVPRDTYITLQRHPGVFERDAGRGYEVSVRSDGTLVFKRLKSVWLPDVELPDPIRTTVALEKISQLVAEFDRIRYFSLKDRYAKVEDGCPAVWTDSASAVTSLTMDGKTKTIEHYYGCHADAGGPIYPEQLTDLEQTIDQILDTKRWLK